MMKKSDQDEERIDRIEQQLKDLRKETDALKNHVVMSDANQRPPTIPSRRHTDKTH